MAFRQLFPSQLTAPADQRELAHLPLIVTWCPETVQSSRGPLKKAGCVFQTPGTHELEVRETPEWRPRWEAFTGSGTARALPRHCRLVGHYSSPSARFESAECFFMNSQSFVCLSSTHFLISLARKLMSRDARSCDLVYGNLFSALNLAGNLASQDL